MEESRGKRKGLRVPVFVEARCQVAGKAPFRGRIINLSTEGIFLKAAEPVEASTRLTLEFLLPGTSLMLLLVHLETFRALGSPFSRYSVNKR